MHILILAAATLLLGGLAGGYLFAHLLASPRRHQTDRGQAKAFTDTLELRRTVHRLEQENNEITLFFVTFPDLIRQLNSSRNRRSIAPVLLRLLQVIFEPGQICIFYRMSSGEGFKLAASQGVPRALQEEGVSVAPDRGRIGWVAEHQIVMDARDFATIPATGEDPRITRRVQIDLCAPMVDTDDDTTLGLITVGALGRYPRNEKKMIKMVADLGTMGLKNAEYHQRIQTLANEDGLTGLYNKRFGSHQLSLGLHAAGQRGEPLSVFLFDIDHFKSYNDTNGHLAGDEVLRQIGKLVRSAIRADDFAARFGGEEFLLVFPDTDKEGALTAAEKVRRQVEGFSFPHRESQPGGRLTISGGIASFPSDSRLSTEMLRLADNALYEAKQQGRNRILACRTPSLSGDVETPALPPSSSPA